MSIAPPAPFPVGLSAMGGCARLLEWMKPKSATSLKLGTHGGAGCEAICGGGGSLSAFTRHETPLSVVWWMRFDCPRLFDCLLCLFRGF